MSKVFDFIHFVSLVQIKKQIGKFLNYKRFCLPWGALEDIDEAVESPDRIEVIFFTQSHFKFTLLLNYKLSIVYTVAYILLKLFTIAIFWSQNNVRRTCAWNFSFKLSSKLLETQLWWITAAVISKKHIQRIHKMHKFYQLISWVFVAE